MGCIHPTAALPVCVCGRESVTAVTMKNKTPPLREFMGNGSRQKITNIYLRTLVTPWKKSAKCYMGQLHTRSFADTMFLLTVAS